MKKYGLNLRVPPSQQKKPLARPLISKPLGFREDDDDDIESEISRQATKNKAVKEIEDQKKKALEEDPSVFDYDGVYDKMKQKAALPLVQERVERKPRYIQHLMKKAEERQREHDIIYERKLTKERSKDEHLYADKDKFVTGAYKKKLAEQAKWIEEQRLRELREERDDVTKKKDLSDFYFSLGKNVAFGSREVEARNAETLAELERLEKKEKEQDTNIAERSHTTPSNPHTESYEEKERHDTRTSTSRARSSEPLDSMLDNREISDSSLKEKSPTIEPSGDQAKPNNHHKRSEDAIAAAKERFLARKRAKQE